MDVKKTKNKTCFLIQLRKYFPVLSENISVSETVPNSEYVRRLRLGLCHIFAAQKRHIFAERYVQCPAKSFTVFGHPWPQKKEGTASYGNR